MTAGKALKYIVFFSLGLIANTLSGAPLNAHHESPSSGSIESGIGLIRGWACDAQQIKIIIDDLIQVLPAYGTSRGDTQSVCGDANNGYGYVYNWNHLSSGEHRLRTFVDGSLIADIPFQVAAMPTPFLRGATREVSLYDFPEIGDHMRLFWSQTHQNFIIAEQQSLSQSTNSIAEIRLTVDVSQLTAQAEYLLTTAGDTLILEAGGLTIQHVSLDGIPWSYTLSNGSLHLALPTQRERLVIDYSFALAGPFEGLFADGAMTSTWPYFCKNLFPCVSNPALGTRYRLQLIGVEKGKTAVYPAHIKDQAPADQLAWAVGDYKYLQLGITDAGTRVGLWTLPNHRSAAEIGAEKLPWVFDWLEKKLGTYIFGADVASVEVNWPNTNGGGMGHHPYWHVETADLDRPETHFHEAAHGWFGNGIRPACWEDFVLAEGLASYLAAVAIGAAYTPETEAQLWQDYANRLQSAINKNNHIAWPEGCGELDVLDIYTWIPYMKGAFFFYDLEQVVGRENLLLALAGFYRQYRGQAATFGQLLDSLKQQTKFDPWPLAISWLRSLTLPHPINL